MDSLNTARLCTVIKQIIVSRLSFTVAFKAMLVTNASVITATRRLPVETFMSHMLWEKAWFVCAFPLHCYILYLCERKNRFLHSENFQAEKHRRETLKPKTKERQYLRTLQVPVAKTKLFMFACCSLFIFYGGTLKWKYNEQHQLKSYSVPE